MLVLSVGAFLLGYLMLSSNVNHGLMSRKLARSLRRASAGVFLCEQSKEGGRCPDTPFWRPNMGISVRRVRGTFYGRLWSF